VSTELMPLSDEQAKAVQEAFKFGGQSLETARAFGGFVSRMLGTVPEDLVGLLGGDWLRTKRAENVAVHMRNAKERLEARGVLEPEPVSLSVALPLLRGAADEDRDELGSIWARLLAAAMDPNRARRVRQEYITIAKQLDPLDAVIFGRLEEPTREYQPSPSHHFAQELSVTVDEVEVSLLHLNNLLVIRDAYARAGEAIGTVSKPRLTSLGRDFRRLLED
jgi:hypothetical protein